MSRGVGEAMSSPDLRSIFWMWIGLLVLTFGVLPLLSGKMMPFSEGSPRWHDIIDILTIVVLPGIFLFLYAHYSTHLHEVRSSMQRSTLNLEASETDGVPILRWRAVGKYPLRVFGYRCEDAAPHSPAEAAERGALIVNTKEWTAEYPDHDAKAGTSVHYSFHLEDTLEYATGFFLATPASILIQTAHVVRAVRVPGDAVSPEEVEKMRLLRDKLEAKKEVAGLREQMASGDNGETFEAEVRKLGTRLQKMARLHELDEVRQEEIKAASFSEKKKEAMLKQHRIDVEVIEDKIIANKI